MWVDPTGLFDYESGEIHDGDTLSSIVADGNERFGTSFTIEQIKNLNGIDDPDKIYIGQNLAALFEWSSASQINVSEQDFSNWYNDSKSIGSLIDSSGITLDFTNNQSYSKAGNIGVGFLEVGLGFGCFYLGYVAAEGVVVTGGASSVTAGKGALESFATGSTLCAYGIARLAGVHNETITSEIVSVFEPLILSVGEAIRNYSR